MSLGVFFVVVTRAQDGMGREEGKMMVSIVHLGCGVVYRMGVRWDAMR